MPERVSNTDIRLRIRLCENSLGRGDPHHMALLDLLDARRERDEAMPVLEAARAQTERHTAAGVKAHLALLIVSGHSCQCGLCMAIRAHDAARAAAKDEGSGALHIGTPLETDHGGEGDEDE